LYSENRFRSERKLIPKYLPKRFSPGLTRVRSEVQNQPEFPANQNPHPNEISPGVEDGSNHSSILTMFLARKSPVMTQVWEEWRNPAHFLDRDWNGCCKSCLALPGNTHPLLLPETYLKATWKRAPPSAQRTAHQPAAARYEIEYGLISQGSETNLRSAFICGDLW
jgi:hypothetical protein